MCLLNLFNITRPQKIEEMLLQTRVEFCLFFLLIYLSLLNALEQQLIARSFKKLFGDSVFFGKIWGFPKELIVKIVYFHTDRYDR